MNPDTIGYVWTGEFDFNTLRVDGEIFESGTKKLRIRKYPDTCGQGLNGCERFFDLCCLIGGSLLTLKRDLIRFLTDPIIQFILGGIYIKTMDNQFTEA